MFVSDFLHQSWIILRGPLLTKNPSSGVSSHCIGIRNPMWGTSQYPFDWVQTNSPSSHMPKFFWLKEFLRFKIEIKKCHNWCPVCSSPLLSCNLTFFLSSVFSLFSNFSHFVISLPDACTWYVGPTVPTSCRPMILYFPFICPLYFPFPTSFHSQLVSIAN